MVNARKGLNDLGCDSTVKKIRLTRSLRELDVLKERLNEEIRLQSSDKLKIQSLEGQLTDTQEEIGSLRERCMIKEQLLQAIIDKNFNLLKEYNQLLDDLDGAIEDRVYLEIDIQSLIEKRNFEEEIFKLMKIELEKLHFIDTDGKKMIDFERFYEIELRNIKDKIRDDFLKINEDNYEAVRHEYEHRYSKIVEEIERQEIVERNLAEEDALKELNEEFLKNKNEIMTLNERENELKSKLDALLRKFNENRERQQLDTDERNQVIAHLDQQLKQIRADAWGLLNFSKNLDAEIAIYDRLVTKHLDKHEMPVRFSIEEYKMAYFNNKDDLAVSHFVPNEEDYKRGDKITLIDQERRELRRQQDEFERQRKIRREREEQERIKRMKEEEEEKRLRELERQRAEERERERFKRLREEEEEKERIRRIQEQMEIDRIKREEEERERMRKIEEEQRRLREAEEVRKRKLQEQEIERQRKQQEDEEEERRRWLERKAEEKRREEERLRKKQEEEEERERKLREAEEARKRKLQELEIQKRLREEEIERQRKQQEDEEEERRRWLERKAEEKRREDEERQRALEEEEREKQKRLKEAEEERKRKQQELEFQRRLREEEDERERQAEIERKRKLEQRQKEEEEEEEKKKKAARESEEIEVSIDFEREKEPSIKPIKHLIPARVRISEGTEAYEVQTKTIETQQVERYQFEQRVQVETEEIRRQEATTEGGEKKVIGINNRFRLDTNNDSTKPNRLQVEQQEEAARLLREKRDHEARILLQILEEETQKRVDADRKKQIDHETRLRIEIENLEKEKQNLLKQQEEHRIRLIREEEEERRLKKLEETTITKKTNETTTTTQQQHQNKQNYCNYVDHCVSSNSGRKHVLVLNQHPTIVGKDKLSKYALKHKANRYVSGAIGILETEINGDYIVLENLSSTKTVNLNGWYLHRFVPDQSINLLYKFNNDIWLKNGDKLRVWSQGASYKLTSSIEFLDIIAENIDNWGVYSKYSVTKLINQDGIDKAVLTQTLLRLSTAGNNNNIKMIKPVPPPPIKLDTIEYSNVQTTNIQTTTTTTTTSTTTELNNRLLQQEEHKILSNYF